MPEQTFDFNAFLAMARTDPENTLGDRIIDAVETIDTFTIKHCDGRDPFSVITWYPSDACTLHHRHSCRYCTETYGGRTGRNTARGLYLHDERSVPMLDAWEFFRTYVWPVHARESARCAQWTGEQSARLEDFGVEEWLRGLGRA